MITIPKSSLESKLRGYFIVALFVLAMTVVIAFAQISTNKMKNAPLSQVVTISPDVGAGFKRTKIVLKPLPQIVPPVGRMLMIRE